MITSQILSLRVVFRLQPNFSIFLSEEFPITTLAAKVNNSITKQVKKCSLSTVPQCHSHWQCQLWAADSCCGVRVIDRVSGSVVYKRNGVP